MYSFLQQQFKHNNPLQPPKYLWWDLILKIIFPLFQVGVGQYHSPWLFCVYVKYQDQ